MGALVEGSGQPGVIPDLTRQALCRDQVFAYIPGSAEQEEGVADFKPKTEFRDATLVDIVVGDDVTDVRLVAGRKSATFDRLSGNRLRARLELAPGAPVFYDVIANVGSLFRGELDALPERGSKKLTFCGPVASRQLRCR